MKSTISLAFTGFQDVPPAELSSVKGGGKIAFTLGGLGIVIGNAVGGDTGGAVGWTVGNAVGKFVESVVGAVT
ncbi:MAG: hypothetical protein SGJ19_09260 [Planctomycetia bacterium]|nr:hypothetical protein [Planctomycetia bacterium]